MNVSVFSDREMRLAMIRNRIGRNLRDVKRLKQFEWILYIRVVQLLHSCEPLFKIIRACGPQPAEIPISKKKGLHLESVSTLDSVTSARHALLYKVAAACDRQDLNCAKLFRGPSWTTLLYMTKFANTGTNSS